MKKTISLLLVLFCLGTGVIKAQFGDILNFNSGNNGEVPIGSLMRSGNLLYGMTNQGGVHDSGNIFSVDTNGNNYTDLFDFSGPNGEWSQGGTLKRSGNKLFGMVNSGGANEGGVIFSIDTNGSGFAILHNFIDSTGEWPFGSLTLIGTKLYGTTNAGGSHGDSGVIFSLDTSGRNYKVLFDCSMPSGGGPYCDLMFSGDLLYGYEDVGGAYNYGCIFSIDTNGNNYKDLLDFNETNGAYPTFGTLKRSGNKLFGMTFAGGTNDSGCVFSTDTNGEEYKDLLDFNGTNGSSPWGSLTLSGNKLFGMTQTGGANNEGIVFVIDTDGTGYEDLQDFNETIGRNPLGDLTLSGNLLYGMTEYGGRDLDGVIFTYNKVVLDIKVLKISDRLVNVYPNPNNGNFTVTLSHPPTGGYQTIEIYNALGEQIYSQFNIKNATFNIDLSNHPNGVYLYRVIANSGELIGEGKLIIQK